MSCAGVGACEEFGVDQGQYSCCGTNDGFCGEWSSGNDVTWINTNAECAKIEFLRVSPGCGVELGGGTSPDGVSPPRFRAGAPLDAKKYKYNAGVYQGGYVDHPVEKER